MTRTRPPGRHLDGRTALDYLEQRLDAEGRREAEEHLGLPCAACHEQILALGHLLDRMRLDRVADPPAALRARALAAFVPVASPATARGFVETLARLLFDSWAEPLPAAVRRAVGDARRLRFALGEAALEIECEVEATEAVSLRGRLEVAEPALHRVEITAGQERLTALPDASGAFALDRVPRGLARVLVTGPAGQFRVPPITL